MVRSFYQSQLERLTIPRDAYDALGNTAQSIFISPLVNNASFVKVNEDTLNSFITTLPAIRLSIPPTTTHKEIDAFVGNYSSSMVLLRFPSGVKIESLDAIQYETLFEKLSKKDNLVLYPLPLDLTHCDNATLDGLNAFYAVNSVTLFKKLTINIDLGEKDNADVFVTKLQSALSNLSRTNLKDLIINDENQVLTEQQVKKLITFVITQKISVNIDLPKTYQSTDLQRQLDKAIAFNQREKNGQLLSATVTKEEEKGPQQQKQVAKRTRKRIDPRQAMKIDIELQHGIEATVELELKIKAKPATVKQGDFNLFRIRDLRMGIIILKTFLNIKK